MPDYEGVNGLREEFKVVGKPNVPGVLSYAVAAGVAKFGGDYVKPDMLFARFLHSPYANARIVRLPSPLCAKPAAPNWCSRSARLPCSIARTPSRIATCPM